MLEYALNVGEDLVESVYAVVFFLKVARKEGVNHLAHLQVRNYQLLQDFHIRYHPQEGVGEGYAGKRY